MARRPPPEGTDCLATANGVLFDTNMLVLLLVGLTAPALIPACGRTKAFEPQHFLVLKSLLSHLRPTAKRIVTPHVAAETWNLLENSLKNPNDLDRVAATYRRYLVDAQESSVSAEELAHHGHFRRLGLTDTGILRLARKKVVVVTADVDLAVALNEKLCAVVNFTNFQFQAEAP